MENYFVPYGLALRLKGVGFYCDCFGDYFKFGNQDPFLVTGDDRYRIEEDNEGEDILRVPAPTFSQAFKWFRDNHRMFHEVFIDTEPSVNEPDKLEFAYLILHMVGPEHMYTDKIKGKRYDTYEESELACLERLIEIIEEHEKGINI